MQIHLYPTVTHISNSVYCLSERRWGFVWYFWRMQLFTYATESHQTFVFIVVFGIRKKNCTKISPDRMGHKASFIRNEYIFRWRSFEQKKMIMLRLFFKSQLWSIHMIMDNVLIAICFICPFRAFIARTTKFVYHTMYTNNKNITLWWLFFSRVY